MKLKVKNQLEQPITYQAGDSIILSYVKENRLTGTVITKQVVAEHKCETGGKFNTTFIYELEPGDFGCESGFIGGFAWENRE